MSDDAKLDTVAKLIRKAESTDSEHERELLFAKAQELITRNCLSELAVHAKLNGGDGKDEPIDSERITFTSIYYKADCHLWWKVAEANFCKILLSDNGPKNRGIILIGRSSDRANVKILVAALQLDIARCTAVIPDDVPIYKNHDKYVWRRSFRLAYAQRIGDRLTEARNASARTYKGKDLLPALVERGEEVDRWMRDQYDVAQTRATRMRGSVHGSAAGRAAASRADTGGARVGAKISGALGTGK